MAMVVSIGVHALEDAGRRPRSSSLLLRIFVTDSFLLREICDYVYER